MNSNKNIALVLSGGGARGLAHIGVIKELLAMGYSINSITGTSMGALVGGLYACGKLDKFEEWVTQLTRYQMLRMLDFSWLNGGLIKGEKAINLLKSEIPNENIEDLAIPFRGISTDLLSQNAVVIESGKVYQAIHASIAIPGIFAPVFSDGKLLVDGGVLHNIPTKFAIKTTPKDLVVAVNVNAFVDNEIQQKKKRIKVNLFKNSNRAIALMMETIGQFNLKENPPDKMINISRQSCELYEFYKAKEQIDVGRICTLEQMK